MFTYLDPGIQERLTAAGKLIRIDERGQQLAYQEPVSSEKLVLNLMGPIPLPLEVRGQTISADWYVSVKRTDFQEVERLAESLRNRGEQSLFSVLAPHMAVNSVLLMGDWKTWSNPLVRVHSNCVTGDVFGSMRCECGPQLYSAIEQIANDPAGGMVVYMAGHEGRGIGLWAKAATYLLQDAGEDTYGANRSLGLPDDCRDFSEAAALLHYFVGSEKKFRLLTNNPKKVDALATMGLDKAEPVKHVVGVGDWNRSYLRAKRDWGHTLDSTDIKS